MAHSLKFPDDGDNEHEVDLIRISKRRACLHSVINGYTATSVPEAAKPGIPPTVGGLEGITRHGQSVSAPAC